MKKFISDTEFVKAWARSKSVREVMSRTGLTKDWVYERAVRLRAAGVALPHHGRRVNRDIAKLNRLYREEKERERGRAALGVADGERVEAEDTASPAGLQGTGRGGVGTDED